MRGRGKQKGATMRGVEAGSLLSGGARYGRTCGGFRCALGPHTWSKCNHPRNVCANQIPYGGKRETPDEFSVLGAHGTKASYVQGA